MQWTSFPVTEQIHIREFYSFFDIHYDKDYSFSGETHNFWECRFVIDGGICISGDDRVYHLTQNQIIFHKPLEMHKFHVESESGATLLIFSFSLEGSLSDVLKDKVFLLKEPQLHILKNLLDLLHSTLDNCREISKIPEHKYLDHDHASGLYFQTLTTYVYQLIFSLIDSGRISKSSTAADARIFSKAVNYINDRLDSQPSVTEIASDCHISVSSLKRIFQKYAGISIHKYILTLKVKAATELLASGTGVTDVSEMLGFSSQAYFSAFYKRETGISPTEVRKS